MLKKTTSLKLPRPSYRVQNWLRVAAYAACAMPWIWTMWQVYAALSSMDSAASLGVNPAETIIRRMGETAFILLLLTLSISPLRTLLQAPWLLIFRRLLGVSSFAYASLHLLAYAGWDQSFSLTDVLADTAKRPFIFVGMAAWLLMLPLAATSFNAAIRWLGGKRWQWLHKAVYVVALLAPLHYWWMKAGKNDVSKPALYALMLAVLLGWRVLRVLKNRRAAVKGTR